MVVAGIDPGWKNLSVAWVKPGDKPFKVEVIKAIVLDVSTNPMDSIEKALKESNLETSQSMSWKLAGIERYAPYANVRTAETENITMVVGMLQMCLFTKGVDCTLYRAIDWKIRLAQTLSKNTSFKNPSSKLDKKFSKAAANEIISNDFILETDHEADAICIAGLTLFKSLGQILDQKRT